VNSSVIIILNSPTLGGAERSMIHQATMLPNNMSIEFLLPTISGSCARDREKLVQYIKHLHPNTSVSFFRFPKRLYSVSRFAPTHALPLLLSLIFFVVRICFIRIWNANTIWCNGNKVAFPFFLAAMLRRHRGKFVWHFRDYPETSGPYKSIWKTLSSTNRIDLITISNSLSVLSSVKSAILGDHVKHYKLYNPVGERIEPRHRLPQHKSFNIGIVSMLAPWKGVHQIIILASLYQEELRNIGVKQISIYGGSIYKTRGEHNSYENQLKHLCEKLKCDIIKFAGNVPPQQIYSEIDLLIHTSIKPEPFGRVIVEGFQAQVPVLSTALGGAAELLADNDTLSARIYPFDYAGIFKKIEEALLDEDFRSAIISHQTQTLLEINKSIEHDLGVICSLL